MTDAELNIALHDLLPREDRRDGYVIAHDYCHDPAWCVAMMEKHKLSADLLIDDYGEENQQWKWFVDNNEHQEERINSDDDDDEPLGKDISLTRAVALAVLALLQRKDGA